jgi:hypothetical protein
MDATMDVMYNLYTKKYCIPILNVIFCYGEYYKKRNKCHSVKTYSLFYNIKYIVDIAWTQNKEKVWS